ncbi:glycosyl hydrolase family 10 [Diaporthe eres]|uniref:Beta-xylanase n=1 Tax=Diaporthe vaccinii TaxID=105482 RepID=A0ABR4FFC9_9PEZI|nr:glycosyl hydrolase family 10 [Diaporthe eres]
MRVYSITGLALSATTASAQLNQLAKAAGKSYFGTGTDNGELYDSAYVKITSSTENYGQLTPANGQKWDQTEPNQGTFSFANGDVVPNFAKKNQQVVRCHTLLYRSQLPSWVTSETWTAETLTSMLETHISNVAGHYKGQCYSWDVVNEAIDDDGEYRDTVFFQALGTDYIPLAFKAAAAADPDAKLYYNDYNIEATNAKQKKTVELVKLVKDAGERIDGVGLQGHFIVGSMSSQEDLESVMNEFVAAGVSEVAYTEFDVKFDSLPYDEAGLEQQAQDYTTVIKACLNVEACVGWTVWDWTDKYSWVPNTFPGQGGACLYDENLEPKPAFYSVSSVLAAATSSPVPTSASSGNVKASATHVISAVAGSASSASSANSTGVVAANQTQPTAARATPTTLATLPLSSSATEAVISASQAAATTGQGLAPTASALSSALVDTASAAADAAPTAADAASAARPSRVPCSKKRRSHARRA